MVLNNIKKFLENYKNLYIPKKITRPPPRPIRPQRPTKSTTSTTSKTEAPEQFETDTSKSYNIISSLVWWLITGYAIYLSFKCNNGFNLGHFILAFLFSPFYIIYHLFATKLCNTI